MGERGSLLTPPAPLLDRRRQPAAAPGSTGGCRGATQRPLQHSAGGGSGSQAGQQLANPNLPSGLQRGTAGMDVSSSGGSSGRDDSDPEWQPEAPHNTAAPAPPFKPRKAADGASTSVQPRPGLRAILACHRCKPKAASRQPADKKPIASKKVGCPFELEVLVEGGTATITERYGHFGHVPGDNNDSRWLSLASVVKDKIVEVCCSCALLRCIAIGSILLPVSSE